MSTKWDADGYGSILAKIQDAEAAYREAYLRVHQQDVVNFVSAAKRCGVSIRGIGEYQQKITDGYRSVQNLVQNMQVHQAEYIAALEQGKQNIQNQAMTAHAYGWINMAAAVSYDASAAYRFAQSGKSFSADYNDLSAFMQTEEYKTAMQKAGVAKWSDTALILDTLVPGLGLGSADDYTRGLLEGGLSSILDGLPGVTEKAAYDGTLDELGAALGIDNLDKWVSEIRNGLSAYGANWKEFVDSDVYKTALKEIEDDEMRRVFADALEKMFTHPGSKAAYQSADCIGTFTDVLDITDLCIDVALRCVNDYSVQVGYLDALEEGILQAGFSSGPLLELIDEMRRNYTDEFAYALDKTSDYLWKEARNGIVGEVMKQVGKYLPVVKSTNLGLKVVSGGATLLWNDEISAYEKLAGLSQYDRCLTASYENYVRMMADGVATEQDVAQADKLFELLRATKAREYEYMIELSGDGAQKQSYQAKLDALNGNDDGRFGGGGGDSRL